jgi:benzaldehyde dehydrogenase (NAD)
MIHSHIFQGSELSPGTHYLMVKHMHEAGFPPGVVNLIQHRAEDASEINTAVIAHRAVRKVNFTGSTRVGSIIASIAGQYLKPALLELGGKAPMIILEDADLEMAAKAAAFSAFNHVINPPGYPSAETTNSELERANLHVCREAYCYG